MPQYFSIEEKQALCQEFLKSGLSQVKFTASKGLGNSTLTRWLNDLGYKIRKKQVAETSKLQQIKVSKPQPITPIQIILNNGTKINLPPNFCTDSLKSIITICEG